MDVAYFSGEFIREFDSTHWTAERELQQFLTIATLFLRGRELMRQLDDTAVVSIGPRKCSAINNPNSVSGLSTVMVKKIFPVCF